MEVAPLSKLSLVSGSLNCLVASYIVKAKSRNDMVLGQFDVHWLSKVFVVLGCWKQLLVLTFSVGFSCGFCGWTLIEGLIGAYKESGCICTFEIFPTWCPSTTHWWWQRRIRSMTDTWGCLSPLINELATSRHSHDHRKWTWLMFSNICLIFFLLFHILTVKKKNFLNTGMSLDSSLEMNATIEVNIRKRWSRGHWW